VIRADIGRPAAWRVTVRNGQLTRLERIESGRIVEWVTRDSTGSLEYQVPSARRRLTIKVTQTRKVGGFDSSIFVF
jgi:YD repeat-containing protein